MIIFHGPKSVIAHPDLKSGNPLNEYGRGFYCTNSKDNAKQWTLTSYKAMEHIVFCGYERITPHYSQTDNNIYLQPYQDFLGFEQDIYVIDIMRNQLKSSDNMSIKRRSYNTK